MPYTVRFTSHAERDFLSLPPAVPARLRPKIDALADNPRPPGSRKLAGGEDRYRIRVGDYRVIYRIDDAAKVVTVTKAGHRSDVYD